MKTKNLGFLVELISLRTYSATVIDVPVIAGKNKIEVSSFIGEPPSCSKSKYGEKCHFSKGETEIALIKAKADWITVESINDVPFNQAALESIGFKSASPSFKNRFSIRWLGLSGLYERSLIKGKKIVTMCVSMHIPSKCLTKLS
jgi:hypothetical protein